MFGAFQSTPPHRGRPGELGASHPPCTVFQSTPPHRGRLVVGTCEDVGPIARQFQSTPPHRGRPVLRRAWFVSNNSACFNPRPRTGGDRKFHSSSVCQIDAGICFNPRPRTGGDLGVYRPLLDADNKGFQSTPPHRGRPASLETGGHVKAYKFQSTPPHRGRLRDSTGFYAPALSGFQSTPPHRGRLASCYWQCRTIDRPGFNPRPRTGGD